MGMICTTCGTAHAPDAPHSWEPASRFADAARLGTDPRPAEISMRPIEGLPISAAAWKMLKLGSETIVAVSEDQGTYLIANGKAVKIVADPLAEPVMVEIKMMWAL